jgi:hypothetical protein
MQVEFYPAEFNIPEKHKVISETERNTVIFCTVTEMKAACSQQGIVFP